MTTTTAVICAYWPQRFKNLPEIVEDINNGDAKPDQIIVMNNNPDETLGKIKGASVINSGRNFTSRSKYAVAMLEPSDYYLLLDDDISVQTGTLAKCLELAHPGCCYGDWGIQMTSNLVTDCQQFTAPNVTEKTPVDIFVGIFQFVSFEAIAKMFEAEAKVRLPKLPMSRSIGEDYLIAMANDAYVIPLHHFDNLISKDLGGVAMQHDPLYGAVREYYCYYMWTTLGHEPFSGPVPEDNGIMERYAEYLKEARETVR